MALLGPSAFAREPPVRIICSSGCRTTAQSQRQLVTITYIERQPRRRAPARSALKCRTPAAPRSSWPCAAPSSWHAPSTSKHVSYTEPCGAWQSDASAGEQAHTHTATMRCGSESLRGLARVWRARGGTQRGCRWPGAADGPWRRTRAGARGPVGARACSAASRARAEVLGR